VLMEFLDNVERDNIFVNFDPANMILYGAGEPIPAVEKLGSRIHSIHCKDATWSDHPGETWGAEVPLGDGDVNMEAFLRTLKKIGYDGPLTIEREIPQEPARQKAEIGRAIELLERLKKQIA
jgi:sugar phosphate isomerase/epimerase